MDLGGATVMETAAVDPQKEVINKQVAVDVHALSPSIQTQTATRQPRHKPLLNQSRLHCHPVSLSLFQIMNQFQRQFLAPQCHPYPYQRFLMNQISPRKNASA